VAVAAPPRAAPRAARREGRRCSPSRPRAYVETARAHSSTNDPDEGRDMRFLFLIRGDSEAEAALRPDERRTIVAEHVAYAAMLRDRGAYVLGEPLTGDAATV